MPTIKRRTCLAIPLIFWANKGYAHSLKHGAINIGHAWALPSYQTDGQVFMPLLNAGPETDALVAARSDNASIIELRNNARYDDPAATSFDLAPGKPFPMRPTARHLRLIGLRQPLVIGEQFQLILDFETAGEVEVEVHVEQVPGP